MGLTRIRAEQISDIDYKQAVRVIELTNVTLAGGAPALVDGVSLNLNDRILVAGQGTTSQNGLYDVTVVGTGTDGTWVRTSDANATGEINAGMIVAVTEGSTYADTLWMLITDNPIDIGVTGLVFQQTTGNGGAYGNANVSTYLSSGNVTTNILTTGNISATGNITGGNIVTSGASGNISGANYITANVFSATGNITGSYIIGNGSQLTGLPAGYSNADVATYLSSGNVTTDILTTAVISASGNIFGGGIRSTTSPTPPSTPSVGDFWYDTTTNAQYRYTFDGTDYFWLDDYGSSVGIDGTFNQVVNGTSNVSINSTNANIIIGVSGVGNVAGFTTAGEYVNGVINATGNISGNYFIGNGSQLTGIISGSTYANANAVAYGEAGWAGNIIPSANNVYSLGSPTAQWASVYVGNATLYLGTTAVSANNTSNTLVVNGNTVVTTTSFGNILTPGNISATGNITGNYIIGNGSQLTGLPASYSNANVATFLAAFGSNTISTSGTINSGNVTGNNLLTAGLVSATGNITGNYHIGNGSQLTSLTGANVTGTVANATYALSAGSAVGTAATITTNAQPNITSTGTLTSLTASGLVSTTGNVSANYVIGNGATLSSLTGANVTGTVANATYALSAGSAVGTAATVTTNAQPNITSTGTLTSLSVTGNTTSGNVTTNGTISVGGITLSGNLIVGAGPTLTIDPNGAGGTDGNVIITGNLTVQGTTTTINSNTVTTNDLQINMANNAATASAANNGGIGVGPAGSEYATLLYNTASNVWVSNLGISSVANVSANNLSANTVTGTLSTAAQNNITSVGTLSSLNSGAISSSGNITGNYHIGNGATLSSITGANVTGTVANSTYALSAGSAVGTAATVTTNAQPNITSVGTLSSLTVTGNTTSGNLLTGGLISATSTITALANISGGNILTANLISAGGNVTGGNLLTGGLISAGGNLTAPNITISGSANISTFIGNVFFGSIPAQPTYYTIAPLNLNNSLAAATKVQLNLINTGGGANAGSAIDFYTYQISVAAANAEARIAAIDDGNYSAWISLQTKTPGSTGTNPLVERVKIDSTGASVAGNVTGGNILTANAISAGGTITGTSHLGTVVSVTANVTGGNILTGGLISATSTITSLANISGGNILTANLISAGGNITGGNILIAAGLSVGGNITSHAILETANITAAAPAATTNFDIITAAIQYYTANANANVTVNFRGNATTTANTLLGVGQSTTVALLWTNGATAYYPTVYQVDGSNVTPKWQGGTAPTGGDATATDVYSFTIIKTAATPTYTVLASQTKFA
jgi:hypothetical protein